MTDGIGLSIGATALTAAVVDRAAVRRSPVLTVYPHRPPEVGVPSENPRLDEPGLVITDFVDRVGDPVGILAADGSSHRGETLVADALRALLFALPRGREPGASIAVTHPAHWPARSVDALRAALAEIPEFGSATAVLPDAAAALTALQAEPGLPARGLIALCDFGGSGTSITVVDAGDGYRQVAPTVRHLDLSGDLIDQALLTHVLAGAGGSVERTGTSAIGSLTRLRGQCRGAKERLSTDRVTALSAELPGGAHEVRVTRTELDDLVRGPFAEFVEVLRHTIERTGARPADLAVVATTGGGARIPIVTTALSENFRVPVITTPRRPELSAAIGAGLTAMGRHDEDRTALAAAAPVAAAPVVGDDAQSGTIGALAWSDAEHIPDIAPVAYDPGADPQELRPRLMFGVPESADDYRPAVTPWYRRPVALAVGAAAVLAALAVAVLLVNREDGDSPPTTDTTTTVTTAEAPAPAAPPPADRPAPQAPAPETVTEAPLLPSEAPPPPAPPADEAPPATSQPPTSQPPTSQPPTSQPPTSQPPTSQPPTSQPAPLIPTLPYTTIPGLPFVPAPPGFGG